jgi:ubiquinone/menaquinone biosynthesis C-methylase UbiE
VRLVEGAAETLPFEHGSFDFVVSSFLLHELPADVRRRALAEMRRVVARDGLVVIVDSIQRGDRPGWDGLIDLFPHYFHEPFYAEYANGSMAEWGRSSGLMPIAEERAFLSKMAVFAPI